MMEHMLNACLNYSRNMVLARKKQITRKPYNHSAAIEIIKEAGEIIRTEILTKKINNHAKRKNNKIIG